MSMLEWAKNEVAIASKRERGNEVSFTEISPEEYKERQRLQEERIKSEAEK